MTRSLAEIARAVVDEAMVYRKDGDSPECWGSSGPYCGTHSFLERSQLIDELNVALAAHERVLTMSQRLRWWRWNLGTRLCDIVGRVGFLAKRVPLCLYLHPFSLIAGTKPSEAAWAAWGWKNMGPDPELGITWFDRPHWTDENVASFVDDAP